MAGTARVGQRLSQYAGRDSAARLQGTGRRTAKRWRFTGYREEAENKLKEFPAPLRGPQRNAARSPGSVSAAADPLSGRCLNVLWRYGRFASAGAATAKKAAFSLWYEDHGETQDIREFDRFYRKVRYAFNKLERGGYIARRGARGFVLNRVVKRA